MQQNGAIPFASRSSVPTPEAIATTSRTSTADAAYGASASRGGLEPFPAAAPLPETPPIRQTSSESNPPRKRRKSRGAGVVSVIMKVMAVVAWIIGIVVMIGAGDSIISAFDPFSFNAIVDVLTENETVKQGLTFIVFGFLFFGVAEIIRLLGDYRR
ncbi:MAG TPA: hypothetical protein DEB24_02730 [Coriobacteriia bacterium]|nr:hypothetical protein [Coriobacteriia bacterium]